MKLLTNLFFIRFQIYLLLFNHAVDYCTMSNNESWRAEYDFKKFKNFIFAWSQLSPTVGRGNDAHGALEWACRGNQDADVHGTGSRTFGGSATTQIWKQHALSHSHTTVRRKASCTRRDSTDTLDPMSALPRTHIHHAPYNFLLCPCFDDLGGVIHMERSGAHLLHRSGNLEILGCAENNENASLHRNTVASHKHRLALSGTL